MRVVHGINVRSSTKDNAIGALQCSDSIFVGQCGQFDGFHIPTSVRQPWGVSFIFPVADAFGDCNQHDVGGIVTGFCPRAKKRAEYCQNPVWVASMAIDNSTAITKNAKYSRKAAQFRLAPKACLVLYFRGSRLRLRLRTSRLDYVAAGRFPFFAFFVPR